MKTTIKQFLAVMAAVSIGAVAARATSLTPGSFIPLSSEPAPSAGALLLDSMSAPVTAVTFTGTLVSKVYTGDASNQWGGLTFTYQLYNDNSSPDSIERLTLTSFAGFLTDVGYNGLGIVPLNAVRNATGNQISFNFSLDLQATLSPGTNSSLLIIRTDSHTWQTSIAGVIDGSTATPNTFAPKAVPEPTTVTLAMLGAVACFLGRRLKS